MSHGQNHGFFILLAKINKPRPPRIDADILFLQDKKMFSIIGGLKSTMETKPFLIQTQFNFTGCLR